MENVAYRCASTGRTVLAWDIQQDVSGIGDEGETAGVVSGSDRLQRWTKGRAILRCRHRRMRFALPASHPW
jgi:hypothetical protein